MVLLTQTGYVMPMQRETDKVTTSQKQVWHVSIHECQESAAATSINFTKEERKFLTGEETYETPVVLPLRGGRRGHTSRRSMATSFQMTNEQKNRQTDGQCH